MGHKASVMREKCCGMVLHGGRPDPVEVVDALTELEAERDVLASRIERMEAAARPFAQLVIRNVTEVVCDITADQVVGLRAAMKGRQP